MAKDSVFRFYNEDTGVHFYTASPDEVNSILANLPSFRFEGPAFEVEAGNVNVYRFFNTDASVHFYTTSAVERDSIIENLPNFNFEGVAYTVDGAGTDVHRYLNTQTGTHFFTQSDAEKASIDANLPHLQYEGVAYQASDRGEHLNGTSGDDVLEASVDGVARDLFGLDGNDTLTSSNGNISHGGNGNDRIIYSRVGFQSNTDAQVHGGAGSDTFVFETQAQSGQVGGTWGNTRILDFNSQQGDLIEIDDPLDGRLGFSGGVSFTVGGDAPNVLENILRIHVVDGDSGAIFSLRMDQGLLTYTGEITLVGVSANDISRDFFTIS